MCIVETRKESSCGMKFLFILVNAIVQAILTLLFFLILVFFARFSRFWVQFIAGTVASWFCICQLQWCFNIKLADFYRRATDKDLFDE